MTDDLVKRLRDRGSSEANCLCGNPVCAEAADRIEELGRALMVAVGYISTKEGHTDQHPQDVYDWITRATLEKKND